MSTGHFRAHEANEKLSLERTHEELAPRERGLVIKWDTLLGESDELRRNM